MTSVGLETHAYNNQLSSNNIDHGAVVDNVDRAFAIRREIALRGMIKADFYNFVVGLPYSDAENSFTDLKEAI
jgi:hypothetical protein